MTQKLHLHMRNMLLILIFLLVGSLHEIAGFGTNVLSTQRGSVTRTLGWVQGADGEWEWEEDDPSFVPEAPTPTTSTATIDTMATATPQLPAGKLKPKQSLGQNYLKDPNTVAKMIRAFHEDATKDGKPLESIIELGPGAGALTDRLVENYGTDTLQCIEIDQRAVEILNERYPDLTIYHEDVLQVNYPEMAERENHPLVVIGNLPYYITSQILFALADASHSGAVRSATVTMQWEVGQRMIAPTSCKVRIQQKHGIQMQTDPRTLQRVDSFQKGLWNFVGCIPNICRRSHPFQDPPNRLLSQTQGG